MSEYLKHDVTMEFNSWEGNLHIIADGYPNTDQPFSLVSRQSRDLFDILRDPAGDAVLYTALIYDSWRDTSTYRTYLNQRRNNSIVFIEKYVTVSAAIAGHHRHRLSLWGY
jgi:hypothetical protein